VSHKPSEDVTPDAPTVPGSATVVTSGTLSAPDLQVTDYDLVKMPDGTFAATLSIANAGDADAGAFHVALYFWTDATTCLDDAILTQEVAVDGLLAGSETTAIFAFALPDLGDAFVCPVFALDSQSEIAPFDAALNLFNPNTLLSVKP
jgi:hypothetical protein